MERIACGGSAVTERSDRTAHGYRRFRCRDCGKQFNERSAGLLDRTLYPSDVVALVVFFRLRYKLSLRDLTEIFLLRGMNSSHEVTTALLQTLPARGVMGLRGERGLCQTSRGVTSRAGSCSGQSGGTAATA